MSKRIFVFLSIMILLATTASCKNNVDINITTTTETTELYKTELSTTIKSTYLFEETAKNDIGGGYIESGKYRQCYYDVPYEFVVLVGVEEYEKWYEEVRVFDPDKSSFVAFIKYFNISKEVFEKTNLQIAKSYAEFNPTMRPLDYENQQTYEIYNADIIYTFDDEIINEYYLTPDYPYCAEFEYKNALEAGVYQTRTTDWVDIEQMEADIIAKYGEAEIVTEEPVTETKSASTTETVSDISETQTT